MSIWACLENSVWAAAFALIVIFAPGWWKLMALISILALNSPRQLPPKEK